MKYPRFIELNEKEIKILENAFGEISEENAAKYKIEVDRYYRLKEVLEEILSIKNSNYKKHTAIKILPTQYDFISSLMEDITDEYIESKELELKQLLENKSTK